MAVPSRDDIDEAADRIGGLVRRTPVVELDGITLKLEMLQHAGSFKPRGAFNTVLAEPAPPARLVAASGGNHGLAVAHVGATLGIPTDIFVPEISAPVKVQAIRDRGATVHQGGADYAAALAASESLAAEDGVLAVHAYDAPLTLAGQGTVARELSEQAPDLDVVVVAVGGGGLVGGIAAWYAGTGTRVVAVEPELCPALHDALAVGHPVRSPVGGIAADALGASQVGLLGFAAAWAATSVLVSDDGIAAARRTLWRELRLVVEPAGATAYAAVETGAVDLRDQRVGVIVCGANTDPSDLASLDSGPPRGAP
ncbi:serine/threonine dehydratase [Nocardioides sp.]|uniref:serine/threonine dehydratase n=1 Tax=Nocardioides sp. TaxID=35761 RepID=UPI002D7FF349|nr:serine/threonine dehydratase [Nocardioides sp.]HET8961950.1 serine/threonine dehydratase [Nocardioides sp.]